MKLTEKQRELIEKLGVVNEKTGLQPAAARIVALLTVADSVEMTFDEIKEALGLSKGAISHATNMLLMMNKLEYITKPGDRKRYFRTRLLQWQEEMDDSRKGLLALSQLLKEVYDARTPNTKAFNKELLNVVGFLEFFHDKLPQLINQWERENQS